MCGIAGFINFEGHNQDDAKARIKRMTDVITHRGPDAEGHFIDECAALGHRRLSIIDLKTGQQPMRTADSRYQVVFNGEIYNFLEIRTKLELRGYRFRTRSDTEVILYAYAEWGETCVEMMNGMFAFAIWDTRDRRLYIARDRVGKKPLYYYQDGKVFAIASELKALRAGDFCLDKLDLQALDCYFTFGYIPSPMTIYQGAQKLRPAFWLLIDSRAVRKSRYWNLSFANKTQASMEEAVEEFQSLLDDAVQIRLMSEVPLGVFLSGGIDSPLVTASMARVMDKPVVTNSIGFFDKKLNELPLARKVAEHLNTDHHEFVVAPNAAEFLARIAWHFDEPFADSSAIPTWYVCLMAKKNVTVALSGDGGDESFGGYTFRYIPHIFESKIRQTLPASLRQVLFGALSTIWPGSRRLPKPLRLKTIFENLTLGDAHAFYQDLVWLRADTRKRLYSHDFLESLQGFVPLEQIWPLYSESDASSALGRSQFTDIHFYLTEDVLVKVDRMSMAHALEVRAPLLDYRIIEFAARLPENLKMNARKGKLLLRRLGAQRLPNTVSKKPKAGFSVPAADWLRKELKILAKDVIFESNSLVSNLLNRNEMRKIWKEHQSGSRDHSVLIWSLTMLNLWDRHHNLSNPNDLNGRNLSFQQLTSGNWQKHAAE